MSFPTTLPRWGDVSAAIVVPTSGKLDVGWVPGERPPAQYLNWWFNLVYQWIKAGYGSAWNWFMPAFSTSMTRLGTGSVSTGADHGVITISGDVLEQIPIRASVGMTIYSVGVVASGDSVHTPALNLFRVNVDGTTTVIQGWSPTASSATFTKQTFDLTSPLVVADGCNYHLSYGGVSVTPSKIASIGVRIGAVL